MYLTLVCLQLPLPEKHPTVAPPATFAYPPTSALRQNLPQKIEHPLLRTRISLPLSLPSPTAPFLRQAVAPHSVRSKPEPNPKVNHPRLHPNHRLPFPLAIPPDHLLASTPHLPAPLPFHVLRPPRLHVPPQLLVNRRRIVPDSSQKVSIVPALTSFSKLVERNAMWTVWSGRGWSVGLRN